MRTAVRSTVFLTGLPRSGTTWAGRVLTAHPLTLRVDEPFNPKTRQRLPLDYPARHLEAEAPVVVSEALRRSVTGLVRLRLRVPREPDLRGPKQLVRDLRGVADVIAAKVRGGAVVVKDPTANFLTSWLYTEFGMKPVVLVRHPCGNAAGYLRMGWSGIDHLDRTGPSAQLLAPDVEYVARHRASLTGDPVLSAALDWRVTNGMLLALRESIPGMVVTRYEDLAEAPAERFPQLAAEVGLPWGRANQATLEELRGGGVDAAALGSRLHVMNRDPRAAASSWRDRLSDDQVATVLQHAGPLAEELGYGP